MAISNPDRNHGKDTVSEVTLPDYEKLIQFGITTADCSCDPAFGKCIYLDEMRHEARILQPCDLFVSLQCT